MFDTLCSLFFFKMSKAHTRVIGFTGVCKHSKKILLFNMCTSQDIVKKVVAPYYI